MKTELSSILNSRPNFDSSHIELIFNVRGRTALSNSNLYSMATDDKKKKLMSLRESISRLETEKTLSKGNKVRQIALQKLIDRFEKDIETLKKL